MGNMLPLLSSSVYTSKGTGCNPTVYEFPGSPFKFCIFKVSCGYVFSSLESGIFLKWPNVAWICHSTGDLLLINFRPHGEFAKQTDIIWVKETWLGHGIIEPTVIICSPYFLSHELRVLIHILFFEPGCECQQRMLTSFMSAGSKFGYISGRTIFSILRMEVTYPLPGLFLTSGNPKSIWRRVLWTITFVQWSD